MFQNFHQLTEYLQHELDWDLQHYDFEDLVYDWTPKELGVKVEYLDKLRAIHQLRAIYPQQPWTVFFVEFDSKRLSISLIRDVLQSLISVRRSADAANRCRFAASGILFLTRFGGKADPQFGLVWFKTDTATNRTVSHYLSAATSDPEPRKERVKELLQTHLQWPDDPKDSEAWSEQWQSIFSEEIETPEVLRDMEESIINGYLRQTNSQTDIPEKHIRLLVRKLHWNQQNIGLCLCALNEALPLYQQIYARLKKNPWDYRRFIDRKRSGRFEEYHRQLDTIHHKIEESSKAYQAAAELGDCHSNQLDSLRAAHKAACYMASLKGSVISAYVDEGRIKEILSGRTKPRVDDAKAMARLKVLLANNRKLETLIITGCQSRVEDIASKLPKVIGLEVEDLVAEGMVGLLKAIEEYDCAMQTDFHYFSYRRVKNAMDAALERSRYFVSIPMTSTEKEIYSLLDRRFVTADGKISGEIEDFFKEQNISPASQERIRTRLHLLVGDHMQFHGKLQAMEKILAEDGAAGGNSDYGKNLDDLTEQVKYTLDTLTDHEKDVLMRRFGIGERMGYSQTLDEVARHYKITRERVRQIEAKALRKLRHPTRIRMFERYIELP